MFIMGTYRWGVRSGEGKGEGEGEGGEMMGPLTTCLPNWAHWRIEPH